jgi:hypothetical protein
MRKFILIFFLILNKKKMSQTTNEILTNKDIIDDKDIYMRPDNFPIENKVDAASETLRYKSISGYLQNEGNPIFNEYDLKSYLITINFDVTTSYKSAWENVQDIRHRINTMLYVKMKDNTELIVSTIEHTHEIPKKHKSSELHLCKAKDEITELYNTAKTNKCRRE